IRPDRRGRRSRPARACPSPYHLLTAPGVGGEAVFQSLLLSFVSMPFGKRSIEVPGEALCGGAGATLVSTKALVAVPYPTESTSALLGSRSPTPPPAAAMKPPA